MVTGRSVKAEMRRSQEKRSRALIFPRLADDLRRIVSLHLCVLQPSGELDGGGIWGRISVRAAEEVARKRERACMAVGDSVVEHFAGEKD